MYPWQTSTPQMQMVLTCCLVMSKKKQLWKVYPILQVWAHIYLHALANFIENYESVKSHPNAQGSVLQS